MSSGAELVLAAAGLLTAFGILWRGLRLHELLAGTRAFLADWNGDPPRPGYAGRPSIPQRMAQLEEHSDTATGQLSALAVGLEQLRAASDLAGAAVGELRAGLARLEARVNEHRTRNEAQVAELKADVDRRLSSISADLLRAETYRAALVELGLDVDPPRPLGRGEAPDHERRHT